jgi:hypothetical protein
MRVRSLRAGLRCLAAVLGLFSLICAGGTDAQQKRRSFEHETTHYRVVSDISPEFTGLVARHMEAIFKEYSRRFRGYGKMKKRFNVAVYKSAAEYERHIPPLVKGSAGVFAADLQLLAAHAEGRTTEAVLRTLYHEGFHQFMYVVIARDCPIWLNEGLAEYFSTATWNGTGFTIGQVPTEHAVTAKRLVSEKSYIPFERLFAMTDQQWLLCTRTNPQAAGVQYVQSWSIVHFLVHARGGRHSPLLVSFLRDLHSGEAADKAFKKAFGEDLAAFEKAWSDYVGSLEPSPKFRCRENMVSLLLLAQWLHKDPHEFTSLKSLREATVEHVRGMWRVVQPSGRVFSSQDKATASDLFHCPLREDESAGYLLVKDPETRLPVLVCMHHGGILMKAYYSPKPGGGYEVRAEEVVREMVPADLRRAITAAGRD